MTHPDAGSFPSFAEFYREVRGFTPYRWQERAAQMIADGTPPEEVIVPTGMGKSDLITAWVWSLAHDLRLQRLGSGSAVGRRVPLRLHFLVDRRAVVDATFELAAKLSNSANSGGGGAAMAAVAAELRRMDAETPLAALRLRGGQDERVEHLRSIHTPAIICSTLDLYGSRLLMRGYGTSEGRRPIDAALTGTDTMVVLDEAHLAVQFRQTLADLAHEAEHLEGVDDGSGRRTLTPMRQVIVATATPTGERGSRLEINFDEETDEARARYERRQNISVTRATLNSEPWSPKKRDQAETAKLLHDAAIEARPTRNGEAVVVFVNTVAMASRVTAALKKVFIANGEKVTARSKKEHRADVVGVIGGAPEPVTQQIMDQLRPYTSGSDERDDAYPLIVVSTQTLEVGVDLDFDRLVTESSSYSSLVQRMGRVNRLGKRDGGSVVVVPAEAVRKEEDCGKCEVCIANKRVKDKKNKKACQNKDIFETSTVYGRASFELFGWIGEQPTTQGELLARFAASDIVTQEKVSGPTLQPLGFPRHVFDELSDTNWDGPEVGTWIRESDDRKRVTLAFRRGLNLVVGEGDEADCEALRRYFDAAPVSPLETWEMSVGQLTEVLRKNVPMVLIDPDGNVSMADKDTPTSAYLTHTLVVDECTVKPGSLVRGNDVSANVPSAPRGFLSSVDLEGLYEQELTWHQALVGAATDELMNIASELTESLDFTPLKESLYWVALPREAAAAETASRQLLLTHQEEVAAEAAQTAMTLGLSSELVDDLRLAGALHDEGKRHPGFQENLAYSNAAHGVPVLVPSAEPLAKSDLVGWQNRRYARLMSTTPKDGRDALPCGYRHEAMSLMVAEPRILDEAHDADLVRYLIATHHGHFHGIPPAISEPGSFGDLGNEYQDHSSERWASWPDLVEGLRSKYGTYTLFQLEAILRLADWGCSARNGEAA